MNRLQSEFQRLYLTGGALRSAAGEVRALVLELAGPADWEALSAVWRGVQLDLQLPAPAIAVSGTDGLQLWFSLQQPVLVARAAAFLAELRRRYLPGVPPARVRLLPTDQRDVQPVPAPQPGTENWSAFVAADLAPVFADTPWLDIPPGIDGQADLLARLASIKPAAFDALVPAESTPAAVPAEPASHLDPRQFLQAVLNDSGAPLALRIEAAKALLPPAR